MTHAALLPDPAQLCMPCRPLASRHLLPATGELQEKGLRGEKGRAIQPLVRFLLEINTSGASTHLLGAQE